MNHLCRKSVSLFIDKRGFGLIDVLISMTIILLVLYAISSGNAVIAKQARQASNYTQFTTIKNNLAVLVQNSTAWANTIANNPSMACLATGSTTPCIDGTGNPLQNQPFK